LWNTRTSRATREAQQKNRPAGCSKRPSGKTQLPRLLFSIFSILLRRAARNLLIVRFHHSPAARFNKDQLALIQGVGTIEIDPLLCLAEFDMQLTTVWLLARGLFEEVLIVQLFPDPLRGRIMVLIERRVRIG
jgi:hypothetical protein